MSYIALYFSVSGRRDPAGLPEGADIGLGILIA